jgi:hypothetical protein
LTTTTASRAAETPEATALRREADLTTTTASRAAETSEATILRNGLNQVRMAQNRSDGRKRPLASTALGVDDVDCSTVPEKVSFHAVF